MLHLYTLLKNKELVFSIVMKVVQMAGGIIVVKLLSNFLTKDEFGIYSLILSIITLFCAFPYSGLNNGILRYAQKYDCQMYFSNMLFVSLIPLVFYLPLVYFFWNEIVGNELNRSEAYIGIVLMFVATMLLNLKIWFQNALKDQHSISLILGADFTIKIFSLLAIYIFYSDFHAMTVIYTLSLSSLVVFIVSTIKYKRFKVSLVKVSASIRLVKEQYNYIYPVIIWSLFLWAQGMVCRTYLGFFSTSENVATFSIMSSLAILPITSITGIIGTYVLPRLFSNPDENTASTLRHINKVLVFSVSCFGAIFIFVAFFPEFIVGVLTSDIYTADSWMLKYMYIAMFIYAIGNILSYAVYTEKTTKNLLVSNSLPGLLSIVVGYYLIKSHDIDGALITFCCSYALAGILNTKVVFKKYYCKL